MTVLLKVDGLTKSFGGVKAARQVSFQLAAGEMLAMIGPNGAGKSTTFNLINGQLAADGGRVLFDGADILGLTPREIYARGIGRTFQIAASFQSLTAGENVALALQSKRGATMRLFSHGMADVETSARTLLARVGLQDVWTQPAGTLAYGDVKRLELAIALAGQPRLLLMDEPTAGMAPEARRQLIALVRQLARDENIGVLFTEHAMDVVFEFADRIVVMSRGRIIAEGSPEAVRANAEVQAVYLGTGATFDAKVAP